MKKAINIAGLAWSAALLILCLPAIALAQEQEQEQEVTSESVPVDTEEEVYSARPALADLIGCKVDLFDWTGFAMWFYDNPKAWAEYGLRKIEGNNPFLSEYESATPITVFGHESRRIAFTSSGLLILLSGVDVHAVAKALEIVPIVDFPGKYMGVRAIKEEEENIFGQKGRKTISLNLSTVTSHPGKVLIGCSYRMDWQD